ncbi:MAG: putative metal-binding motif-containing protein [Candidatus Nanoarchaeia archaeon]
MKRFVFLFFVVLFSVFVFAECVDEDNDGYGAVGTDISTCPASQMYYDCDDTNSGVYPWTDVGACGMCDGLLGMVIPKPGYYCPPTICSPASGCGVGNCGPNVFGVMPSEMFNYCLMDGSCSAFECQATCEPDEDMDSYSTSCGDCDDTNAQSYPWQIFDVCAMCDPFVGVIIPPFYPCPNTICPESGCGVGDCGAHIFGIYPETVPNYCLEPYVCSENTCKLTCESDGDGDGYSVSCGDCNDEDATIYAGAVELCDGKDNDCDNVIPEGEVDSDGDSVFVCAGDCNDAESTIYPGAIELCDGKDNDCDGITPSDETDSDGDGFALCAGDCDDADSAINSGAEEICDNKDNNCNDLVDEIDDDSDGVYDCTDDKCLGSVPWFAQNLKPNHYDSSNWPASVLNYGCTCDQVLYCKPGGDEGELKFGCTIGTVNVWTQQIGWSLDCQQDEKVAMEGESKDLFENTDNDLLLDLVDGDKDNDGIPNSEDSESESKPVEEGKSGKGSPDWWCNKHPGKC